MEAESALARWREIDEIPTLPVILQRVNRMLSDFDVSIHKMGKVIESDPAMASRVLKLVNSSFYGLRSKIGNVRHALILLGFNSVRNAIISVSVFDVFKGSGWKEGAEEFWRHSAAVATTSKYLAEATKLIAAEDAFVGGLLHDIGKVAIARYFPGAMERIRKSVRDSGKDLCEAEKEQLCFTHADMGGHLAQKWQFPLNLIQAIRCHHSPNKDAADANLLLIVHCANRIVKSGGQRWTGLNSPLPFSPEALTVLIPVLAACPEWFGRLSAEMETAGRFFIQEK